MAARLAHPDSQVVLLLGDGAAGFSLMDVDTLVRHRLPVVMVVGNNGAWGLEKHPMRFLYGYDVAADLQPQTRYDDVVRALGGQGETVTDPEQIGPALDRAFAGARPTWSTWSPIPRSRTPAAPPGCDGARRHPRGHSRAHLRRHSRAGPGGPARRADRHRRPDPRLPTRPAARWPTVTPGTCEALRDAAKRAGGPSCSTRSSPRRHLLGTVTVCRTSTVWSEIARPARPRSGCSPSRRGPGGRGRRPARPRGRRSPGREGVIGSSWWCSTATRQPFGGTGGWAFVGPPNVTGSRSPAYGCWPTSATSHVRTPTVRTSLRASAGTSAGRTGVRCPRRRVK